MLTEEFMELEDKFQVSDKLTVNVSSLKSNPNDFLLFIGGRSPSVRLQFDRQRREWKKYTKTPAHTPNTNVYSNDIPPHSVNQSELLFVVELKN